jgi:hypothetical protein
VSLEELLESSLPQAARGMARATAARTASRVRRVVMEMSRFVGGLTRASP